MQKTLIQNLLTLAAALSLAGLAYSPAHAQSTAFTYQGRLDDAGAPTSGLHDFRFRLFDAASGGAQIGSTLCVDDVNVIEGVFTAQLDFGQQYATAAQRHLEIEVRLDSGLSCGDVTGFIVMAPRQQVTAAPMASHANAAFALDASDGSPANAVYVDSDGRVGVGTTSPQNSLHVNGDIRWGTGADFAYSGKDGSGLFVEQKATSAATSRIRIQSSKSGDQLNYAQFNIDPNLGFSFLNFGTGNYNVGIGTQTPAAKLDVRGDVKLGASGEFFAVKSPANDRSVRGAILSTGTIDATRSSPGFTVTHTSTGVYSINFTTPFTSPPTVVVSATAICCRARVTTTATGSAFVHVLAYSGDALTDSPFHFIAMGP